MLRHDLLNLCSITRIDITEQHTLQSGQTGFHAKPTQNGTQPGLQSQRSLILDAAVFDVDSEEKSAIALLVPAKMIVYTGDIGRMRFRQGTAEVLFDLCLETIDTPIGNQVLEPGAFAVFTVSVVALNFDNGFADGDDLCRGCERQSFRQCRERLLCGRRAPHATTGEDVVADDLVILHNRHQSQVLRVQIHTVVFRESDRHLEFSWQISRSVDGLVYWLEFCGLSLLTVFVLQPEIKVGRGSRAKVLSHLQGQRLNLVAHCVITNWSRAGHDVAVHVTTGSKGGQLDAVDFPDTLSQIFFQNAMQLKSLAAGNSQCAICQLFAEIQLCKELFGGDTPARDPRAYHAAVLLALCLTVFVLCLARIAVVLKVGAVVLQQRGGVIRELRLVVDDFLGQCAAKLVRSFLE